MVIDMKYSDLNYSRFGIKKDELKEYNPAINSSFEEAVINALNNEKFAEEKLETIYKRLNEKPLATIEEKRKLIFSLITDFNLSFTLQELDNDAYLIYEREKEDSSIFQEIITSLSEPKLKSSGIYKLVEYCLNKFEIITLEENSDIFVYDSGVYVPGEKRLVQHIQRKISQRDKGRLITNHVINEFLGHIRRSTYRKLQKLEEPIDKICLENGVLDLKTLKVEEHNPYLIFFNKLPVYYDPSARGQTIKKFLREIVPEDCVAVLEEVAGYCLYKRHFIHIAFMLVGIGRNGKSTFINLLRALLGPNNCSSIPLQQLENNRFAASNLFGKLANLFADLPARALRETSLFKMLTGEDLIPGEKKFKDAFFFTNYSKLIFSCNQIPRSPDDSDGFFRRWIILNFPNNFEGSSCDKKLIDKLTTPEELSGFLNIALEGLKRLLKTGDFSSAQSIEAVREEYIRKSDSVASFVMDCVCISPDDHISKKELYTAYADYCRLYNSPVVPENTFHRQLQAQVRVEDYRPLKEVEGKKIRVQTWRGIIFQPETREAKKVDNPDNPDKDVNHVNDVRVFSLLSFRSDPVHLPCSVCGKTQDAGLTRNLKDKPICDSCAKTYEETLS